MTTAPTTRSADLRAAMHANALAALRQGSRIGRRADVAEIEPWLLIDADADREFLNVAVPTVEVVDPVAAVDGAEAWFAGRGPGFCYLLREDRDAGVVALLGARGHTVQHRLPAMLMAPLAPAEPWPRGLEVDEVTGAAELEEYAGLGGSEQGLDRPLMRAIAGLAFGAPGFLLLVGRVGGVPVATSLALLRGPVVGVYNVNVTPGMRGRGLGTAMTWAAIERGRRAGAEAAFLELTPASHRLYERMGFRWQYAYLQVAGHET